MIVEKLIFTFISFSIFVYMFLKMIKNNDTSYVIILVLEAIGIALNFLEVLFGIKLNILFVMLKYILAIIIPIFVIALEKRGGSLVELLGLSKVKILMLMGNNKKAKEVLLKLIDKKKDSYKAHKALAELYEKEGGMRKAIDEYVQAIDLNKQDYNSYYKVAELLNGLEKQKEAAEMLFDLLNKKPDMYNASVLLGNILLDTQMYKEAANVYQNALKYNPLSYDLNYNLGIAYTMLNDFQNAKICYEKAAEINTLAFNSKYCLAEIALINKDLEEAEKKFLEAIEEEELSADGYYELAKIYLIKGDKDTAIKYVNTAIDLNSKRITDKVKKDPIFIPIMARVAKVINLEDTTKEENLSKKDITAKTHLEKMAEITRNLGYNDIIMLRKNVGSKKPKEQEKEEQTDQRERQD